MLVAILVAYKRVMFVRWIRRKQGIESMSINQHMMSQQRRSETWTYSFASGELFRGAKVVDAMTGDIGAS